MFPPTFKFDPDTDIYDTSMKQRTPAWCDRILVKGTEESRGGAGSVASREYACVREARHSDHRCVWGLFDLCIAT